MQQTYSTRFELKKASDHPASFTNEFNQPECSHVLFQNCEIGKRLSHRQSSAKWQLSPTRPVSSSVKYASTLSPSWKLVNMSKKASRCFDEALPHQCPRMSLQGARTLRLREPTKLHALPSFNPSATCSIMVSSTSVLCSRLPFAIEDSMDGTTPCLETATMRTKFSVLHSITLFPLDNLGPPDRHPSSLHSLPKRQAH